MVAYTTQDKIREPKRASYMMMAARSWICQRRALKYSLTLTVLIILSACSNYIFPASTENIKNQTASRWEPSGSITLSRSNPGQAISNSYDTPSTALGFVPASLHGAPTGSWVSIDTSKKSLELMKGDQVVAHLSGLGVESLKPGLFKVKHKQRNPLWYAPDSYFTARSLPTPMEGDKARFRRGALGDFVIFLDQDTPIHSGPIWLDSIGGVKMDEAELSKLYYSLEVGAAVEVK